MHAIQYVDYFGADGLAAHEALEGLKLQQGYLGGRLLEPNDVVRQWRVQAFFQDEPVAAGGWLPEGCRRVFIPRGLMRQLAIQAPEADGR